LTPQSSQPPGAPSSRRSGSGSPPAGGRKAEIVVKSGVKPDNEPEKGWTTVHAEGPTLLLVFAFVASVATVVVLAIYLGGGM
jgi:hypothetical protein